MLTISLLGPVEARESGRSIPLGGAKQRILLARLAIAGGRPVQPDLLVEDLWGSRPPADPAHALQAHVSRLRSRLPVEVGLSHGGYLLDCAEVTVDATVFQDRADRGRRQLADGQPEAAGVELRSALNLWHGPALADLPDVTGLRPFAVRLEELRGSVLTDRIDADLARGEHASLVAELQGLVESAPEQERTWAQLIRALAGSGRRSEALDAFRGAREALLEHQGIDPGPELVELHRAVLNDDVEAPATRRTPLLATSAPRPPVAAEPAMPLPPEVARRAVGGHTGREEEMAALSRAWSRRTHGPQLITLTGEPGIGKTRLAAEFAARCAAQGARVLFGRCEEALSVPYQPFMEMLRSEVATTPSTELAARLGPDPGRLGDVLPGLVDAAPGEVIPARAARSADPDLERYRTFDAVAGWLAAASSEVPLVLVVDDLQWADHATLMLLQHLMRTTHDIEACIVATHRDREHEESDPISRLVAPLLRPTETSTRVAMSHLPEPEIVELLTSELAAAGADARPSPETARWVGRASGGNPLFVVELARQLADDVEATDVDRTPPVGVREVVNERVQRLPDGLPALLRSAAVVGRTFDPQVLQAVEQLDDEALDELLTAATYTRLIERTSGQRLQYSFSHDLVRRTLYESLPPVRRSRLHREVGEALERRHLVDLKPHYSELAHHFAAAAEVGDATEAIRYLTLAGASASAQGAPVVAAKHYGRALALVDQRVDPGQYCDLLTARGQAECQAGRASYRETLLASARIALDTGDATRLAEAAVLNAREWWTGTPAIDDERLVVLESALSTLDPADLVTRVKLLAARAVEKVRDTAQRDEALADSRQAVRLARELGDTDLLAHALGEHYAVLYATFANPRECVAITLELVDLARISGDPARQLTAAISHAQSTATVGDLRASDAFLELAEAAVVEMHQPSRLWMVRTWVAMRRALHGDLERAEREVAAAFELGTSTEQPEAATWFAGQMFTLRWMAGRLPEIVDEVERHVDAQAQVMPAWRAAHALALAEAGRTDDAAEILDDFVCRDLADLPRDFLWLHAVAYLAGACVRVGRADVATLLHRKLLPYSGLWIDNGTLDSGPVDLHLGLLAGMVAHDPVGGPDDASLMMHRQAQRHLTDAIQQCRRVDAPVWQERARAALGRSTDRTRADRSDRSRS